MSWIFKFKKKKPQTGFSYTRQPVFMEHVWKEDSLLALGLFYILSVTRASAYWSQPLCSPIACPSWGAWPLWAVDHPALTAANRQVAGHQVQPITQPSHLLGQEWRLDGKEAVLGKAPLPLIALESLGILPHKINAGAIKANLFHTHKAMLGNWPRHGQGGWGSVALRAKLTGAAYPASTGCSAQTGCAPQLGDPRKQLDMRHLPQSWARGKLQLWDKPHVLHAEPSHRGSHQAATTRSNHGAAAAAPYLRPSTNNVAAGSNTFCSYGLARLCVTAPTTKPGRLKPMMPSSDSIAATSHIPFIPSNIFTAFVIL